MASRSTSATYPGETFVKLAKRASLPRIRLYDLRHCNATHLADQGTPIHVVQRRLGHSSPATTFRYYTHVLPDTERAAADRLAMRLLGPVLDAGDSKMALNGHAVTREDHAERLALQGFACGGPVCKEFEPPPNFPSRPF